MNVTDSIVYVGLCRLLPGVYLDSEEAHPPNLRAEPSQPEEAGLGFWLVRPGGGLEGAATDSALGGRGTFHSSWAREELDTEPPPGDHFDSLGLAARRKEHFILLPILLNSSRLFVLRGGGKRTRRQRLKLQTGAHT